MKNIFSVLLTRFRLPFDESANVPRPTSLLARFFRLTPAGRITVYVLSGVFTASLLLLLISIDGSFFESVPAQGGHIREGIVGTPRAINPVLALLEADKDMVALVYSGLIRRNDGDFIPDLAESWTLSEDKKTYTVRLKAGLVWHDGAPVTTDDVLFTVERIRNEITQSPLRESWLNVTLEKIDPLAFTITLPESYAPFIENLTQPIIPKHVWEGIAPEEMTFSTANIEAIGTGPYKVARVERGGQGIPRSIELEAFEKFALGRPYVDGITVTFFENEDLAHEALESGAIDAAAGLTPALISPDLVNSKIVASPLPRVFAVFLNPESAPVFSLPEVRTALDAAVDRTRISQEIFGGFTSPVRGPLPPSVYPSTKVGADSVPNPEAIVQTLTQAGWVRGTDNVLEKKTKNGTTRFAFTLSTSNSPELRAVGENLKKSWEAIGAKVTLKVYEKSDLNQNIIRPRAYEALLFGQVLGRTPDPYVFWHSRERQDPGLNVALHASRDTDAALEGIRDGVESTDVLYRKFHDSVVKDTSAVFLYSPELVYVLPEDLQGIDLGTVNTASDRFTNIHASYLYTERVWNIFSN